MGALAALSTAGCFGGDPPLPPDEALRRADARVTRILDEDREFAAARPLQSADVRPQDTGHVTFWFYTHPAIAPVAAQPARIQAFNAARPGVTLKAQFIGDWSVAVQKLTVTLAAGDMPDIAMVKRGWLARLARAGLLMPLDGYLPASFLSDFDPRIREALRCDGRLYALPADGFCSVLFHNSDLVADPPATWQGLRDAALPIGDLPFLETLYSADGAVVDGDRSRLTEPPALEALSFILELRDAGLLTPLTLGHPAGGLRAFLDGRVAMTVASSEEWPRAAAARFPAAMAPVPGKSGPISMLGDNALVVFAKHAEARRAAVAEVLDFLTGPEVQGLDAAALGSVPVRRSVAAEVAVPEGLRAAFERARWTPLLPSWNAVEADLLRHLDLAYRWKPDQDAAR